MKDYVTTGAIQTRSGLPYWKVAYILRTRDIKPEGRIGPSRVYSPEVIDQVKRINASMGRNRSVQEVV